MEKLTIQEEDVMLRIWQTAPCYIKDILATFPDPKPPYTTLASVVKNLERKKYVKARRHGNTYNYIPKIAQHDYKYEFMNSVVTNYFANSYKEMVSFFAKEEKLSANDLKEIISLIEKGQE